MYLHIGNGLVLNDKDIIAIFNIDYIKNTKDYKKFYEQLLEENRIVDISKNNPNINSNTIGKRKF